MEVVIPYSIRWVATNNTVGSNLPLLRYPEMYDQNKYPVLNSKFVVRQTRKGEPFTNLISFSFPKQNKEYILYDWHDGVIYDLDLLQVEILRLCNSTNSVDDIIHHKSLSKINKESIKAFIDNQIYQEVIHLHPKSKTIESPIHNLPEQSMSEHIRLIQWEISSLCNLRCSHCYNYVYLGGKELSTEQCKLLIDKFDKLNPLFIQISGGEPLLRTDLFEILKYIEDRKITVSYFFSNALLLNEDNLNDLINLRSNLLFIFSCDGFNKESYELIRGNGTFESFINALEYLQELDKDIAANIMLHQGNIKNPEKIIEFLLKYLPNIKRFRFGTFMRNNQGRFEKTKKSIGISIAQELKAYKKILTFYYGNNLQNKYQLELSKIFQSRIFNRGLLQYSEKSHPCGYVGGQTITIKPDGAVWFCPALFQLSFGNVLTEDLVDILKSSQYSHFVNLSMTELEGCNSCRFRLLCGGGCRAWVYPELKQCDTTACEAMEYLEKEIIPILPSNVAEILLSAIL